MRSQIRTVRYATLALALCSGLAWLWFQDVGEATKQLEPSLVAASDSLAMSAAPTELQGQPTLEVARKELPAATKAPSLSSPTVTPKRNPISISGRVVLLDSTPLEGVDVRAKVSSQSTAAYAFEVHAKTDVEGQFTFIDLPPGFYDLTVHSSWPLPVQNPTPVMMGSGPVVLVVAALRIRAQITGTYEQISSIDHIRCTRTVSNPAPGSLPDAHDEDTTLSAENEEDEGAPFERLLADIDAANELAKLDTRPIRRTRRPITGQWIQHADFVVPTTSSFSFRSVVDATYSASNMNWAIPYLGTLLAGQPSGSLLLELTQSHTDYGSLVVQVQQPELPKGARLHVGQIMRNGKSLFDLSARSCSPAPGVLELPLYGLLPGLYEFPVTLTDGKTVVLEQSQVQAYVSGGMQTEHTLPTSVWAQLHLSATSPAAPAPGTFAKLTIQKPDSETWDPMPLHTRETGNGAHRTSRRSGVLVGGPAAISDPLPPGTYTIRLTLPGHMPLQQTIELRAGETNAFTLRLQPD